MECSHHGVPRKEHCSQVSAVTSLAGICGQTEEGRHRQATISDRSVPRAGAERELLLPPRPPLPAQSKPSILYKANDTLSGANHCGNGRGAPGRGLHSKDQAGGAGAHVFPGHADSDSWEPRSTTARAAVSTPALPFPKAPTPVSPAQCLTHSVPKCILK